MKKNILNIYAKPILFGTFCTLALFSCNKDLPQPEAIQNTAVNGSTVGGLIDSNANFTFFKAAATRVGLMPLLMDRTSRFTAFVPDNAAFIASGIPSIAVINALPLTSVGGIVGYHIVPGQEFPSSNISDAFPNMQLPNTISLAPLIPGTALPFKMTLFPSRRGSNLWLNNVPFTSADMRVGNGIIHVISRVVTPPSATLDSVIYKDPNLTLFSAVILRSGVGQPAASQLNLVLGNPGANLTVFAPNNTALKATINLLSGGAVPIGAPDATFIAFINNNLPVATAQGVVAYHFLANAASPTSVVPWRAFSTNFSTTPTFYKTLVNAAAFPHPGVTVQSFFTGQFTDSIKVTGVANGGIAAIAKPTTNFDKQGVNGVVHIIDRVLLPQ